jgi:hypothetical protein
MLDYVLPPVNSRELGTVLAGLRYWQRDMPGSKDLQMIATDDGEHVPLDEDEIDNLCEHLNCARPFMVRVTASHDQTPACHTEDQWLGDTKTFLVWAVREDDVLDEFHAHVPIKVLEDWNVEICEWSAEEISDGS